MKVEKRGNALMVFEYQNKNLIFIRKSMETTVQLLCLMRVSAWFACCVQLKTYPGWRLLEAQHTTFSNL